MLINKLEVTLNMMSTLGLRGWLFSQECDVGSKRNLLIPEVFPPGPQGAGDARQFRAQFKSFIPATLPLESCGRSRVSRASFAALGFLRCLLPVPPKEHPLSSPGALLHTHFLTAWAAPFIISAIFYLRWSLINHLLHIT